MLLEISKGNSLAVQWLGLHASTADSLALISGGRTKIPQALRWGKKKKKKKSAKWLPLVWWCDSKRHEGVSEVLESLFL